MMPLPDPTEELTLLQQKAVEIGQFLYQSLVPSLRVIGQYALQIGLAMAGLSMAFGGRGRSIASTFVEVCALSAIVWVFCVGMWPQTLLGNLRSALLMPAVQLGNQIAHSAGLMGNTPTQWLMSWINGGATIGGLNLNNPTCKFSMYWIQDSPVGLWQDQSLIASLKTSSQSVDAALGAAKIQQTAWAIGLYSAFLFGLGSIFVALLGAYLTAIVSIFSFALTQLFVLGGGELAWNLYIPLGMLLIPLIYFGMCRAYWRHYLVTLVALAILPALFWIMAGIGVAIMATLFNAIFGLGTLGSVGTFIRSAVVQATGGTINGAAGAAGGAASGLTGGALGVIWQWISQAMNNIGLGTVLGPIGSNSGMHLDQYLLWMFQFSGYFLRYVVGVTIVGAFIAVATTVAVTAVQVAFSWTNSFSAAANAWINAHREHMDRIGGAVSGGIGQMAGGMFQQAGDFFRGLPRRKGPPGP